MANKGLYLDGDPVSLPNGITTFALNVELDSNGVAYQNSKGFTISITDSSLSNVLGVCELPDGVILFGRYTPTHPTIIIKWYKETSNGLIEHKTIYSSYIRSSTVETVSAVYTYNYKKELILNICFTKDDNIYLINLDTFDTTKAEDRDYMKNMILVPDLTYPTIRLISTQGSLYPGTYQIAIQYKLDTGDYTNFSTLSVPFTITHDSTSSYDKATNKGISIYISNETYKDTAFRIAIIKITPSSQEAFITNEFITKVDSTANIQIVNVDGYNKITIDSILIKTMPVIGAEDCTINNNRLLLSNIKINKIDDDIIDSIKSKLNNLVFNVSISYLTSKVFTIGEMYIFYLGIYDRKGVISTILPINIGGVSSTNMNVRVIETYGLLLENLENEIGIDNVKADISVDLTYLNNIDTRGQVSGYVILMAEHTEHNSIILSHALAIRDGYDTNTEGYYSYQNLHSNNLRVYPFEYLYNRQSSISCGIKRHYSYLGVDSPKGYFKLERDRLDKNPHDRGGGSDNFDAGFHGSLNDGAGVVWYGSIISPVEDLKFINPLSEAEKNIQGDSFYRCVTTPNSFMQSHNLENPGHDEWINSWPLSLSAFGKDADIAKIHRQRAFKLYLYNPVYTSSGSYNLLSNLYGDVNSQKLAIVSSFIQINHKYAAVLSGDSYYATMGVKVKSPGHTFSITRAEKNDDINSLDTKTGTTNQIVLSGKVISKYNLEARYQEKSDIHNFVLKNGNYALIKSWANDSYEYDSNFGQNDGDIYSKVANENGIEYFAVDTEIDKHKINILQNRIIRSDVIGTESLALGWRNFRPTSYSDIDSSKGHIVSIDSSDKNIYIQCQYGLKVNQIKDVLNINEAENTYLGTGDLFDRQSVEIMYSPIGYIGCSHKNHCYYSVFGYIVIDVFNKRIFLINDQGVHCISDRGISEWCKVHLNNLGEYSISVDQNNKTIYIHKSDNSKNDINDYDSIYDIDRFRTFTLAYNIITNTFISFNSWIVDRGFCASRYYILPNSSSNRTIMALSDTKRGVYGYRNNAPVYCPSILKLLFTEGNKGSQLLKALLWDTKHYNNNNIDDTKTFSSIFVHTANQASDILPIDISNSITNWWDGHKGSNQKNVYQFNAFHDILHDKKLLPVSNLLTGYKPITTLDRDSIWFDKASFINTYFFAILLYNNFDYNNKFVINTVAVDTIQNYR